MKTKNYIVLWQGNSRENTNNYENAFGLADKRIWRWFITILKKNAAMLAPRHDPEEALPSAVIRDT